jgi:pyruvyltransferase
MIKCFYERNKRNFGDMLTPMIVEFVSGQKIEYCNGKTSGKLLCIGSGMNRWLLPNDIVYGYGSRNTDRFGKIIVPENVKIWLVRGKLTRDNIIKDNPGVEVPEVYGDPALLMPLIYNPDVKKEYEIGFIPHYIDKGRYDIKRKDVNVIDIQGDPKQVIREIKKCKTIISTSMHGLITADTYGIPVVWLQISDNVLGAWFKFNDYFSGVGRGKHDPVVIKGKTIHSSDLFKIVDKTLPRPVIDRQGIIDAWKGCI